MKIVNSSKFLVYKFDYAYLFRVNYCQKIDMCFMYKEKCILIFQCSRNDFDLKNKDIANYNLFFVMSRQAMSV